MQAKSSMMLTNIYKFAGIIFVVLSAQEVLAMCPSKPNNHLEVLHHWNTLDYKFPPWVSTRHMQNTGKFVPEHNSLFLMDVFEGNIFVNVMRGSWATKFRDGSGVPSTLNRVVIWNGRSLLEPFPSLESQTIGNCNALQNVGGFRVDKSTGLLWAVDFGTVNRFQVCPAKVVVIDTRSGKFVRIIPIPPSVFIGGHIIDIVFIADHGQTRYLLMPDYVDQKLIVHDLVANKWWYFEDKTLEAETCASRFAAGDDVIRNNPGIRNLVVPQGSKYVYYSALGGFNLYQIPINILLQPGADLSKYARKVGEFPQQPHSLIAGRRHLYYADFNRGALKIWNFPKDLHKCRDESKIKLRSIETIVQNIDAIPFARALSLDNGYLYYISNNLAEQRLRTITFKGCESNFIIGRVFVNDMSPLEMIPTHFKKKVY